MVKLKNRPPYSKEYYLKNREKLLADCKEYYQNNKHVRHKYLLSNPAKYLWTRAKHTAKKRELEFTITPEDIIIPTTCPFFGWELTFTPGQPRVNTTISIDRIDSSKGYIPGNVQVISWLANLMKTNATAEELLLFAKGVERIYGQTPQ